MSLYRGLLRDVIKYNIPANINKNITLHKSVTAAGENNRQQEIKELTSHKTGRLRINLPQNREVKN